MDGFYLCQCHAELFQEILVYIICVRCCTDGMGTDAVLMYRVWVNTLSILVAKGRSNEIYSRRKEVRHGRNGHREREACMVTWAANASVTQLCNVGTYKQPDNSQHLAGKKKS